MGQFERRAIGRLGLNSHLQAPAAESPAHQGSKVEFQASLCGRRRPFEPSAWMGGRVSRCLRRSGNEWCRGEVRKYRKAEAHLKWFSDNQMVEPLVDEQRVAWRPFNWGHPRGLADGAPAERHGCLLSCLGWSVWSLEPASHTSTWVLTHPGCFWPVTETDWTVLRSRRLR